MNYLNKILCIEKRHGRNNKNNNNKNNKNELK
jgi:hypothetical protein